MREHAFLWAAAAFYAGGSALTVRRLRAGGASESLHRWNVATLVLGFLATTGFLYLRGQNLGRCPLTNAMETTVFLMWSAVLFYLLVGPAYRVSFLGAFTAPLSLLLCLVALLGLSDARAPIPDKHSPWVEFHAAIGVLACGALGLAGVVGRMYLMQERQLKTRRLLPSFLEFPSLEQLDVIGLRLLLLGFAMLTVGMIGGEISYRVVGHWTAPKIAWAVATWVGYGAMVVWRLRKMLNGRKAAQAAVYGFAAMLVTYWVAGVLR